GPQKKIFKLSILSIRNDYRRKTGAGGRFAPDPRISFFLRGGRMSKVRVAGFGVSLDGFSAGIEQSLNDPLGKRGTEIFQWFFQTRTFCEMHGREGGAVNLDDEFARMAMDNFGAFILGRNMFGPVRGPWLDSSWKGWWGDNPPYHTPTFVLTHYE